MAGTGPNVSALFLREWREYHGLSLTTLGQRIGAHHSTLSKMETGKRTYLNEERLARIAQEYKMSASNLYVRPPPRSSSRSHRAATLKSQQDTPAANPAEELGLLLNGLRPDQARAFIEIIRLIRSLF
jgi:transcriptional regulator with XRE-family HTH domain